MTDKVIPSTRRRRGGQPGNRNALRHGLYARHFPEDLKPALARWDLDDFTAEIQLLRVCMDAIIKDLLATSPGDDLRVKQINAISNAVSSLTRASAQHLLNNSNRNPLLVAWYETVAAHPFFIDDPQKTK